MKKFIVELPTKRNKKDIFITEDFINFKRVSKKDIEKIDKKELAHTNDIKELNTLLRSYVDDC